MVPPHSLRIPRARRYSGYCRPLKVFAYEAITLSGSASHRIRLTFRVTYAVLTPATFPSPVWPLPFSLATTYGISFDFSSSAYLDVSVRQVPFLYLCIQYRIHGSSPCGFPHSEICGSSAYLQLTAAYRSLSRPSSAPDAKAFPLCSSSLELLCIYPLDIQVLFLNCFVITFTVTFSLQQNCVFPILRKDLFSLSFSFRIPVRVLLLFIRFSMSISVLSHFQERLVPAMGAFMFLTQGCLDP